MDFCLKGGVSMMAKLPEGRCPYDIGRDSGLGRIAGHKKTGGKGPHFPPSPAPP